MRTKAIMGACLLVARLAAGSAATAGTRIVIAVAPPPPPQIEYVRPVPYYRSTVWIPGHWIVRGGWVWVPGCWVRRPYRGACRVPGRWATRGCAWVRRGGERDRDGRQH